MRIGQTERGSVTCCQASGGNWKERENTEMGSRGQLGALVPIGQSGPSTFPIHFRYGVSSHLSSFYLLSAHLNLRDALSPTLIFTQYGLKALSG
jgi:hypothetical protein